MHIIRATRRDVPLLVPLFLGYLDFYHITADRAEVRRYLTRRLAAGEATVFLALDGKGRGRRGLGFTLLYPTFSSLSMARAWVLNDLFVAPEARRGGVARALLDRARALGASTHAVYLTLETAKSNRRAQALYESLGWTRGEGFYQYTLRLGAGH
jgi:ribosomal protein S18 acetylase RimI-like enzyme